MLYARVSSKDQEREGFSIPAHKQFLQQYTADNDLMVVEEFVDVETAKRAGCTNFSRHVCQAHGTVPRRRPVNLVDYYKRELGPDISKLTAAGGGDLSIVAFVDPNTAAPGRDVQRLFQAMPVERQVAFLLGFHFCVLIDQAIHDAIRPLHSRFDAVVRYPKLRGILASYWTNMHPALLLGVASSRVDVSAINSTTAAFRGLSTHVVEEYARFLVEDFADLTDTARGDVARDQLLVPVFRSLSGGYTLFSLPSATPTSFPYRVGIMPPRRELYTEWCGIVRDDIKRVGDAAGARR